MNIFSWVDEVFFIGNPEAVYTHVYMYAINFPKNSKLTIHLKNMNIRATSGFINTWYPDDVTDVNLELVIDCIGENSLTALNSGGNVITNYQTLTITGAGNLTITAGNAIDRTTAGATGYDGGTAIIVDNLTVDMEKTGTLTVFGGNGGKDRKQ